jgi:hypothetical protein
MSEKVQNETTSIAPARKEVEKLEKKLSWVKGLTPSPHRFSNDRNACRKFQVLV